MTPVPPTTVEAVEQYLDGRELTGVDAVNAAAARRLARILDGADNASGAANASRELRQMLDRLIESEPQPESDLDRIKRKYELRMAEHRAGMSQ